MNDRSDGLLLGHGKIDSDFSVAYYLFTGGSGLNVVNHLVEQDFNLSLEVGLDLSDKSAVAATDLDLEGER